MKNRILSRFDYFLILIVLTLVTTGILFIYSSSINSEGISVTNEYIKQIIWASAGIVCMVTATLYDYRKLESSSLWLYLGLILLLVYTRIFGRYVNGAKSWIGIGEFGIQPSEFGKIFFILFLARYLDRSQNSDSQLRRFIAATAILLVPMGLILIQPDLGTASVYIPVFLLMCFIAGIPLRYIMYILLMGIMTIVFAIAPVWNTEIAKTPHAAISILTDMRLRMILVGASAAISLIGFAVRRYFRGAGYWFWLTYIMSIITVSLVMSVVLGKVLKYYQIKRLIVFMDPQTDPLGSGWNIIQSKIAIGAGGIFGRGYLNGTQSHYRFLPQQSTDFIFSILSEELGFAGGCMVFLLYFLIFTRILRIMKKTPNRYGLYILAGILAMFSFHFFINVGMVMGMMPITGIPLLFLSYGGSSLLSAMTCVGLIMSISSRRGLK